LPGHAGAEAIGHDNDHHGEEGGKPQALDREHDRGDRDRQEQGGKNHPFRV
jgi:hypothetical protein